MVGKRYTSRKHPRASFSVGMGHEGVRSRVKRCVGQNHIPGANPHHQIDMVDFKHEWVKVGDMLVSYSDQIIRLLVSLCRVAKCGTRRGRYVRITSFQAEAVLLLVIAWVITVLCYGLDIII